MRHRYSPFLATATASLIALSAALCGPTITANADATAARDMPSGVTTDVSSLTFDSFDSDFHLTRDDNGHAQLRTVETLVAQFPSADINHGIERVIPLMYDDVLLHTEIVSVTDGNGDALSYTREDAYGSATLRIGDADSYVHGAQTYVITYTQRDVVRSFADTNADEFYWDVNGTDWQVPFGTVTARVHLGEELVDALTGEQACYAGAYGRNDVACTIDRDGATITSSALDLASGENLTIAVGFDRSTFAEAPRAGDSWLFTVAPWLLYGGMAVALLWILGIRLVLWRDAPGRGVIVAQYEAPKKVHPALAAELLGKRKRAFGAEIVNFAVNRVVRLREFPSDPKWKRYELELLTDDTSRLLEPEVRLLRAIMNGLKVRSVRRLDSRDRKLGDRLAKVRGQERNQVLANGLRARPSWHPAIPVGALAALIIVFSMIVVSIAGDRAVDSSLVGLLPFTSIAVFTLVFFCGVPPLAMTDKGAEIRDHLLGMRDYLTLAEADRIRVLQAPGTAERIDVTDRSAVIALYERLLPYAMVLGVDRQWTAELDREYETTQAPDWYAGTTGTIAGVTLLSTIGASGFSTTPTPSSSSGGSGSSGGGSYSGGSSGGGSSGGGGGGGGGGGW